MGMLSFIKSGVWTEVTDTEGIPVKFSHGLNRDDDAVKCYPAECNMTVIDLSGNDSTVVSAVPALLLGIYIDVTIGTTAVTIDDDTTAKITLPVAIAVGSNLDFHAALFATNLTVNPADDSTGTITVFWMVA